MSTMAAPSLAVISASAGGAPGTLLTSSPDQAQATLAAWGSCQIHLVADRVTSLHTGSTHKVYRGWRFAVAMRQGQPQPGAILFTVPVDPALPAKGQTRYALVQLANQGAIDVGEAAAFSWSATSIGTTDPFAAALEQVRRELDAAGWRQDAMIPTRYGKTDPTPHPREEPETALSDTAGTVALSGAAAAPTHGWVGAPLTGHAAAPRDDGARCVGDGWGHVERTGSKRAPPRQLDTHCCGGLMERSRPMESWSLVALVNLVLLVLLGVLRWHAQTTHHPHHAPEERSTAHRLSAGAVR